MRLRSIVVTSGVAIGLAALAPSGVATAATSIPFQINPAPYGNPNGSLDLPAFSCVAVVDERPGSVRISGGNHEGWGCLIYSEVSWVNLSTGASGVAWMSDGLGGAPPEAVMATGPGHVLLALRPTEGVITPGAASFYVP